MIRRDAAAGTIARGQRVTAGTGEGGRMATAVESELLRLRTAMQAEARWRMRISSVALACAALLVPWWVALACLLVDAIADRMALARLDRFAETRRRGDALAFYALLLVGNVSFVIPAALMLAAGPPLEAFLGMFYVFGSLLHITTVLAVHRRAAIMTLAAVIVPLTAASATAFATRGDYTFLWLTCLASLAVVAYTVSAILSTSTLHGDLAEAQRESERATEARERLLAVMSHEMRTPLNAVAGITEALRTAPGRLPEPGHVEILGAASDDMRALVDDLLDLAAVDAGGLRITRAPGDPEEEVRRAVAQHRVAAAEKGLELTLEVEPGLPAHALIDRLRLRQAVTNLVSNAVKYTEAGAVRVRLGPAGAGHLRVSVQDTGPGIPPAARERIFEPFARLEDRPGSKILGVGLGLPLARELARRMGGDLTLDAGGAGGARFVLTVAAPPCAAAAAPARRAVDLPSGLHVLVVDDVPTNRIVARLYLDGLGARVSEAEDGWGALAALARETVDAVLLDMRMPGIDGAETLARIRASGAPWAAVPVIAMTADAGAADRQAAIEAGFDGYVPKPVDRTVLARALAGAIDGSGRAERNAGPAAAPRPIEVPAAPPA